MLTAGPGRARSAKAGAVRWWRARRTGVEIRDQRGSVLVLVPAGFLVLIFLGAIAVDSAATFLGQRQLSDALAAASNDAAAAALADGSFYQGGYHRIDAATAATIVCESVAAQTMSDVHDVHLELAVAGATVEVRATARVDAVFGRLIPGFGRRPIRAEASAVAEAGGGPVNLPALPFVPLIC